MIVGNAGVLLLVSHIEWSGAYLLMAGLIGIGQDHDMAALEIRRKSPVPLGVRTLGCGSGDKAQLSHRIGILLALAKIDYR